MKSRPFSWPLIAGVAGSCLACFAAQALLWEYLVSHRARLVATNSYVITLSRLQNVSLLTGNTVILGSSITERLMPSADIAVIGVPGSCFLAGMRLMPHENFSPGTVVVIEANNLFSGVNEDVMTKTQERSFRFFRGSRHFSIAAMPSSLLLSAAYFKMGSYTAGSNDRSCLSDTPPEVSSPSLADAWTEERRQKYANLCEGVHNLRARGYRVCMVFVPERDSRRHDEIWGDLMAFASEMDIPVLDYMQASFVSELKLTDSVHLDSKAASTARFRNTVARDAHCCAR